MEGTSPLLTLSCSGTYANQSKVALVCVNKGCSHHPFLCLVEECSCHNTHSRHRVIQVRGFFEAVNSPVQFDEEITRIIKSITAAYDDLLSRVNESKTMFLTWTEHIRGLQHQFGDIRRKLQARDFSVGLCGDLLSQVIDEIEHPKKIAYPFLQPESSFPTDIAAPSVSFVEQGLQKLESMWRSPYDFLVSASPTNDDAVVFLNVNKLNQWKVFKGDLVSVRKLADTYQLCCVILVADTNKRKALLTTGICSNLKVAYGDIVRLECLPSEVPNFKKIIIHTLQDARGLSIEAELFPKYLIPYFKDTYRPVVSGQHFTIRGQRILDFKVAETEPASFGIVNPATVLVVGDKAVRVDGKAILAKRP